MSSEYQLTQPVELSATGSPLQQRTAATDHDTYGLSETAREERRLLRESSSKKSFVDTVTSLEHAAEVFEEVVYNVEEREALVTACLWRQLRKMHVAVCDGLLQHFYSSAALLFAEAAGRVFAARPTAAANSSHLQRPSPRRGVVKSAGSAGASQVRNSARSASTTNSTSTTGALIQPRQQVPLSARSSATRTSSVGARQANVSSPVDRRGSSVTRRPAVPPPQEVRLPIRSLTPVRKASAIPPPAPSVQALLDERRRCAARKDILRQQMADGTGDEGVCLRDGSDLNDSRQFNGTDDANSITTAQRRTSSVDSKRITVLHSVPNAHHRTIAAQRSPVNRRTSPVRQPPFSVPQHENPTLTSAQRSSSAKVRDVSPVARRSPLMRPASTASAGSVPPLSSLTRPRPVATITPRVSSSMRSSSRGGLTATAATTTTESSHVVVSTHLTTYRVETTEEHSCVELSSALVDSAPSSQPATARSCSVLTSGDAPATSRSVSVQSSQVNAQHLRVARSVGARRPSPPQNPRRASLMVTANGTIHLNPNASPSARFAPPEQTAADYASRVLRCVINRSLEVDSVPDPSLTPLRERDLILELDGASIATLEHLRLHFENIYSGKKQSSSSSGRVSGTLGGTNTVSVSLLRGNEYVELVLELPRHDVALSTASSRSASMQLPPARTAANEDVPQLEATAPAGPELVAETHQV